MTTNATDPAIRSPAGTFLGQLSEGFFAPFAGFAFLNRNAGLWRYAMLPMLINLLLTALIIAGAVWLLWWAAPQVNEAFDDTWMGWLMLLASWLGLIFAVVAGVFLLYLISLQVLCAFFFGRLAVESEVALGMPREELREVSLWQQTVDATRDVFSLLAVMFVCLVLNCVPVIGTVVALVAVWYFDGFVFGRDFLDYPLSLRAMRRAEKLAFCRRNRAHTLGLGSSALLMSLVPVLGSIFLATAVTGAVILHRRIELGNVKPQ
ncbi:MAG: EI24 domain-containing protein [Pirellulales bacterium]|nr:EI24 domain-containing protein [Pirellulales bacterium]